MCIYKPEHRHCSYTVEIYYPRQAKKHKADSKFIYLQQQ